MTKRFYLVCIVVICILLPISIFTIIKIGRQHSASLPAFEFKTLDGKTFVATGLPIKNNYLILYFAPECHYCTDEINDIIKNKNYFIDCFFVLVSPTDIGQLKIYDSFLSDKGVHYQIVSDAENHFSEFFGPANFPSTYLYDKDRILVNKFLGGTSAKNLQNFINGTQN